MFGLLWGMAAAARRVTCITGTAWQDKTASSAAAGGPAAPRSGRADRGPQQPGHGARAAGPHLQRIQQHAAQAAPVGGRAEQRVAGAQRQRVRADRARPRLDQQAAAQQRLHVARRPLARAVRRDHHLLGGRACRHAPQAPVYPKLTLPYEVEGRALGWVPPLRLPETRPGSTTLI